MRMTHATGQENAVSTGMGRRGFLSPSAGRSSWSLCGLFPQQLRMGPAPRRRQGILEAVLEQARDLAESKGQRTLYSALTRGRERLRDREGETGADTEAETWRKAILRVWFAGLGGSLGPFHNNTKMHSAPFALVTLALTVQKPRRVKPQHKPQPCTAVAVFFIALSVLKKPHSPKTVLDEAIKMVHFYETLTLEYMSF